MIKIRVDLLNTETNELRLDYTPDFEYDNLDDVIFIWSEHNFGCDCNRSLFFYNWDKERTLGCNSGDNIIKIKIYDMETSRIVYSEY